MLLDDNVGPLLGYCPLPDQLIISDRVMFLSRQDLGRRLRERSKSLCGIGVAVLAGSGIPHDGILDILGLTDTDFGIVAHGKFGGRKSCFGGFLCKGEGEDFVLVETSTRGVSV